MAETSEQPAQPQLVTSPWSRSAEETVAEVAGNVETGLSRREARRRLKQYGPNLLRAAARASGWTLFANQFKSFIVALLGAAAVLSVVFEGWQGLAEAAAIAVVILINAAIGFFTELRAARSMEALKQLGRVQTKVRRKGQVAEMRADLLVPGDVVILEAGDIITADLRLVQASRLQADESALTGESVPVDKGVEAVEAGKPLAERTSMLYKGTAITRGAAEGVVVATGMSTELGRISTLVEQAEEQETPLQKQLDRLGHRLIGVTLGIVVAVTLAGVITDKGIVLMVKTGIALAVAAIPEGLPIVATLALARGMWRMAKHNAIVNRLAAVETLGSTGVICTDKTGTLTENRMAVTQFVLADGDVTVSGDAVRPEGVFARDGVTLDVPDAGPLREAIEVGVLCNDAVLQLQPSGQPRPVGDPLEVALLVCGAKAGIEHEKLVERAPEVREEAFDPDVVMMATFHEAGGAFRVAAKGAPESVLKACTHIRTQDGDHDLGEAERAQWLERSEALAGEGLRMLGLATKTVDSQDAEPYTDLTLLGLVGLMDPPRVDVRDSIAACRGAGIRVVMVTGDQAATAASIGSAVGLLEGDVQAVQGSELENLAEASEEDRQRFLDTAVFARVSPEQKLNLIDLHQDAGAIVAMTGDGVNDAPALKKADIGVAMGLRGTQVAREAADMVLKDDSFGTIVHAVAQGRVIFGNIRKFVFYLLSCNLSEILSVFLASLINAPLPILPLQILFLNLVTDVFPALALGMGEGDPEIMSRPPRDPTEPVLTRRHWLGVLGYGSLMTVSVLTALGIARGLGMETPRAVTISFLTLAFCQLWHVFNLRERGTTVRSNDIVRNPYVWAALAMCVVMLVLAAYVPVLARVLRIESPGVLGWLIAVGMSLVPCVAGQLLLSRKVKP